MKFEMTYSFGWFPKTLDFGLSCYHKVKFKLSFGNKYKIHINWPSLV